MHEISFAFYLMISLVVSVYIVTARNHCHWSQQLSKVCFDSGQSVTIVSSWPSFKIILLTLVLGRSLSSVSKSLLCRLLFSPRVIGSPCNGKCNHVNSVTSFNVPSLWHASPSGLDASLRCITLPSCSTFLVGLTVMAVSGSCWTPVETGLEKNRHFQGEFTFVLCT